MTVEELLGRMSSQEVAEWYLFDRIRAAEAEAQQKHAAKQASRNRR